MLARILVLRSKGEFSTEFSIFVIMSFVIYSQGTQSLRLVSPYGSYSIKL